MPGDGPPPSAEALPSVPYFAWVSDHDLWQPGWLESLAAELDAHPDALLAYPHVQRIGEEESSCARPASVRHGRRDRPPPAAPVRGEGLRTGVMVYGLDRVEALERLPAFRRDLAGPAPARSAGARGPVVQVSRPGRGATGRASSRASAAVEDALSRPDRSRIRPVVGVARPLVLSLSARRGRGRQDPRRRHVRRDRVPSRGPAAAPQPAAPAPPCGEGAPSDMLRA